MPQTACEDRVWKGFLTHLRGSVDNRNFAAWFQGLRLLELDDLQLTATAPNPFVKSYLERNFRAALEDAVRHCLGPEAVVRVRYIPGDPAGEPARNRAADPRAPDSRAPDAGGEGSGTGERKPAPPPGRSHDAPRESGSVPELHLNERYLFDNFVVGPNNQLSHAACLQVISAPAAAYNPLFIHGASGLGKTHLLQATCRAFSDRNPSLRVLYVSCEEFMNRFVDALKRQALDSFRRRLRRLDCLAVDDIHFLAGKKRMQEEFFHTFNALYDANKQVILSSDSKPDDMLDFEDRLLTRFQWGLMTSMMPPPRETRVSIAGRKARSLGHALPDEVADLVAEVAHTSVRAIEGVINKIIALADLYRRPLDLELAQEALSDHLSAPSSRAASPSRIASEVAARFGVTVADLKSARRARRLLIPRQIAIHLTRMLLGSSLSEIGEFYGGRDHSTVANALRRVEGMISDDDAIRENVEQLRTILLTR